MDDVLLSLARLPERFLAYRFDVKVAAANRRITVSRWGRTLAWLFLRDEKATLVTGAGPDVSWALADPAAVTGLVRAVCVAVGATVPSVRDVDDAIEHPL